MDHSKDEPVVEENVMEEEIPEVIAKTNPTESCVAEDLQGGGDQLPADMEQSNVEYIKLKNEGNDLAKAGHLTASLEKYQEAMEKARTKTEYSVLKHNKGIVFEAMKDYSIALEHYEAALALNPNYYKALKRKCKMLKQLGSYEDARRNMKDVFLMERKEKMGKQQDTQEMWQAIIMSIGIRKGQSLVKEDKPVEPTDSEVEAVLRLFYCDPVSILWKKRPYVMNDSSSENKRGYAAAVDALHRKKYGLIISHCDDELANPSSEFKEDAHMLRGTFKLIWGYEKSALHDFTAVLTSENDKISHKTKSSAAVKCAYCLYHRSVDEEQMLLFISIARDNWEMNSDAYFILAMMRKQCHKDYDSAAQFLQIAVEYCPVTEPDHMYNTEFMEILFLKDHHSRHNDLLNDMKVLEKRFDVPECYYNYYQMLKKKDRVADAKVMIEKALTMDPKNPNYHIAIIMDEPFEKTPSNIIGKLKDLRRIEKICGHNHLISYHIGCLELFLGNMNFGWTAFNESIDNCRSIFTIAERIVRKLDWEMDEELDKALNERNAKYTIDPTLFSRSKLYEMKLTTRLPLCTHCGRECDLESMHSEDTDEDDE